MPRGTILLPSWTPLSPEPFGVAARTMNSLFWERAQGGLTHFPIVLIFVATFFDLITFSRGRSSEQRRDFGEIGYWLVILTALGAIGAVLSGLVLTKWQASGTGMVRLHHLFVWPSFALILALVAWRVLARNQMSRQVFACYLFSIRGRLRANRRRRLRRRRDVIRPNYVTRDSNCGHNRGGCSRETSFPDELRALSRRRCARR